MGGNFWNLGRMPRDAYLQREASLRAYLEARVPMEYRIPLYYPDKADFGDMDVLLSAEVLRRAPEFLPTLFKDLGITGHKNIGTMITTAFNGLQTDFFICPATDLESSFVFMSWGEVGNILGRLARRFHLKFGIDGLTYVFRWGDHYKREFGLTKDFEVICEFFKLDYKTWKRGFANREAMFRWVTASPWFSAKPYLDPDSPMAQRASVRPGIAAFIDYVKANVPEDAGDYVEDPIAWVSAAFPYANLMGRIRNEQEKTTKLALVNEKFNGRVVMELCPGLDGKALGEFIKAFRQSKGDFQAYVASTPAEQVREDIRTFVSAERSHCRENGLGSP